MTSVWVYGIMALIIYSAILYFVLKKYFNEVKRNYHRLLEATNEIADGNLDVEIDENLVYSSHLKKKSRRSRADSRRR